MNKSSKLFENIASLVSLKGLEYLLNFILFPYLLRVLGAERFGAIAFMQGIVQYFVIVVDYGFNMTGPRDIARAGSDKETGRIFSNIMGAKLGIFGMLTVGAAVFMTITDQVSYDSQALFWVVYLLAAGNLLFPIWFFQGIQQMRYITIVNVLARGMVLMLVFITVKGPDDYLKAAFLQSCTMVLAGLFSYYILFTKYHFIFQCPSLSGMKETLQDGWAIFFSTIAINVYTTTNTVVLGFMTNNEAVGYFSAANKLMESGKGLMVAVTQAVYPHVSALLGDSEEKALSFLKRFFRWYCGFFSLGTVIILLGAGIIIHLLFGNGYEASIVILQWMALIPAAVSVSNVYGIQIMLNFGKQRAFSQILMCAAILDVVCVIPLGYLYSGTGVAVTMSMVELFVAAATMWYVRTRMNVQVP